MAGSKLQPETGRNDADSSLLVYNRRSLPQREVVTCPNMVGFVFVSASTGAIVPASCQRNGCSVCGVRRALATAVAVDMVGAERMVTLTLVGESSRECRQRLSRWRYDLRSEGYRWEEWGAIERNPAGSGFHYHGFQRGDFVPVRKISAAARRRGMGEVVDIRRHKTVRGSGGGAVYATKAVTMYGVKGATEEHLSEWLNLNGNRNGIWSRGFFGQPYNAALRAAMGRVERDNHDPGPWSLRGTAGGIRVSATV